jgi:CRP-like cAMP-binding protein
MVLSKPLPAAPLITKLETLGTLTDAARDALARLRHTIRQLAPHDVLVREGDQPSSIFLMVEGCVFRSTVVAGGQRQIMSLHIAGDLVSPCGYALLLVEAKPRNSANMSGLIECPARRSNVGGRTTCRQEA